MGNQTGKVREDGDLNDTLPTPEQSNSSGSKYETAYERVKRIRKKNLSTFTSQFYESTKMQFYQHVDELRSVSNFDPDEVRQPKYHGYIVSPEPRNIMEVRPSSHSTQINVSAFKQP